MTGSFQKKAISCFCGEKENPKVPFYTLEVEPDGTIRQKRAEFNRQNKDIDKVTSFFNIVAEGNSETINPKRS